jgi:O-acetylhomoserine/O-acetylserine sulfhydrylase-like pyridoxal-dependent enzyme
MEKQPSPLRVSCVHSFRSCITDPLYSSGKAAVFMAVTALAQAGSNIVVASNVSDSTVHQFRHRLPPLGITARFVESGEIGQVERAIDEHTKGVFVDCVSITDLLVSDIETLAAVAHHAGVPLIV